MLDLLTLLAQNSTGGGSTAPGMLAMIIAVLLVVIQLALFIYVIVDVAKSPKEPLYKVIWIAIVFFFPCIGAIAYLILRDKL